ncbi:MAG: phage holin family protein [Candidatus Rokubacteria bacterium]|nr:phage holin family protein [Candidatus Rokubacteria bacterium]
MASVRRLDVPRDADSSGVIDRLGRLAKLELELGLAETREVAVAALIAGAIALVAAAALVAALVVLIAGAIAPLFDAPGEPLVIAGGGVVLLALAVLAWSAYRLTHLEWPRETLASLRETWRWLAGQTRSRLTLR